MPDEMVDISRRAVLATGTLGIAGALTGCAVYGQPQAAPPANPSPVDAAPSASAEPGGDPSGEPGGAASGEPGASAEPGAAAEPDAPADSGASAEPAGTDSQGGGSGTRVASTSEVAVGGGYISTEHNVVVTQPAAGQYRAFNATCTHAGCPVSSVDNGVINCVCHNSAFSIQDGSVRGGPAPSSLAEVPVTVNGDSIEI